MTPKGWAILVVALLVLILMLQNLGNIRVQLFFWRIDIPLVLLILLTTVIGFIIGYFISSVSPKKRK